MWWCCYCRATLTATATSMASAAAVLSVAQQSTCMCVCVLVYKADTGMSSSTAWRVWRACQHSELVHRYTHTPTQAQWEIDERHTYSSAVKCELSDMQTHTHTCTQALRESKTHTYTDRAVKWEHTHTHTHTHTTRFTSHDLLPGGRSLARTHSLTQSLSRPPARWSPLRESKAKCDTHSHRLVVVVLNSPQHIWFRRSQQQRRRLTALHKLFVLRRVWILSPSLPLLVCVFLYFSPLRLSVAHEIRRSNAEKQRRNARASSPNNNNSKNNTSHLFFSLLKLCFFRVFFVFVQRKKLRECRKCQRPTDKRLQFV